MDIFYIFVLRLKIYTAAYPSVPYSLLPPHSSNTCPTSSQPLSHSSHLLSSIGLQKRFHFSFLHLNHNLIFNSSTSFSSIMVVMALLPARFGSSAAYLDLSS